jgi:hypothetical protein
LVVPDRVRHGLLAALLLLTAFVSFAGNLAYAGEASHGHRAQRELVEAFPVQMGATGVAGFVRVYVESGGAQGPVAAGIYSDVRGRPGSLLSQGHAEALKPHAWNTLSITPARLISNQTYWLAVLGPIAAHNGRSHSSRLCLTEAPGTADLGVLPARWQDGRRGTRRPCRVAGYVVAPGSAAAIGLQGSGGRVSSGALDGDADDAVAAEPPVLAEAPVASEPPAVLSEAPANTAAPTITGSAIVGERVSASTGSWRGDPTSYAYQWEDCDALGEGCLGIRDAQSSTYELSAGDLDSVLRVVVTATNAAGATEATSAPTQPVASPAAPRSTSPPVVSGSANEGRTLTATTGTWAGSPTAYAYQWQDCNSAGNGCSNIKHATTSTHLLGAGDVGHTIRVTVTASNAVGSAASSSNQTSVVTAGKEAEGTGTHCFENPEYEGTGRIEACHYPGLHNVGVMTVKSSGTEEGLIEGGGISTPGYYSCQQLWEKGTLTSKVEGGIDPAENATVANEWILGNAIISHSHVTLKHDCITERAVEGPIIDTECGAEYLKVEESDVYGKNSSTEVAAMGVYDGCGKEGGHQTPVLTKDALWNCGECINGNAEASQTFIDSNAEQPNGEPGGLHIEDVFMNGGIFTATNDTLLNPATQTAIVFFTKDLGPGSEPCTDEVEIKESLIAGSGAMFQSCPESHPAGGTFEVTNSRFARCTKNISGGVGEERCKSPQAWEEAAETAGFCAKAEAECLGKGKKRARLSGEGEGFFPLGQANDGPLLGCKPCAGEGHGGTFTWSGNVWDNNLEAVDIDG